MVAGAAALVVAVVTVSVWGFGLPAGVAAGATYVVMLLAIDYISLAEWEPVVGPVRAALAARRR
jgi:hypothetical protein